MTASHEHAVPDWKQYSPPWAGYLAQGLGHMHTALAHLLPGREYALSVTGGDLAKTSLLPTIVRAGKGRMFAQTRMADAVLVLGQPDVMPHGSRLLNADCADMDKTRLHTAFAEVFGYSPVLDPKTNTGIMVHADAGNGAGLTRLAHGPVHNAQGVHTRLINNSDNGSHVQDLHVPVIGGVPVLVMRATRWMHRRFSHAHSRVCLQNVQQVFTPEEVGGISAFCAHTGLDVGSLDILRDRDDGRIYILDADPGRMGPVTQLAPLAQWQAIGHLARAMRAYIVLGRAQ